MTICNCLLFPLALFTEIGEIKLTKHERLLLNKDFLDSLWQSDFSKSFLAWRRRLLYCASALLMVTVALRAYNIALYGLYGEDDKAVLTTLGLCALVSDMISPFVSFVFLFVAAWVWPNFSKSRNILIPGWILGLTLSLWPSLIPLEYIFVESTTLEIVVRAVLYALGVLPTYLSLIGGLTLGARRVYMFAPSPMTGAMVVLGAAFSIVIPFAVMSLIIQTMGNVLLLVGFILLVAGPFLVVIMCSKFTDVNVFSPSGSIVFGTRILQVALVLRLAGFAVMLAWFITFSKDGIVFITQEVDGETVQGLVPIPWLVSFFFRFLGNMMYQAVLWTDIMMHVARKDHVKIVKLETDLAEWSVIEPRTARFAANCARQCWCSTWRCINWWTDFIGFMEKCGTKG